MNFDEIKKRFEKTRLLLIGDLMLDQYIYGKVDRISPEAPVPVFVAQKKNQMIGGAGNVYRNLLSLNVNTTFLSIIGNDAYGSVLLKLVKTISNKPALIFTEKKRTSTVKTRYLNNNQQLIRIDNESNSNISQNSENYLLLLHCDSISSTLCSISNKQLISDFPK